MEITEKKTLKQIGNISGKCADCNYSFDKLYYCRKTKKDRWRLVCGNCCKNSHLIISIKLKHD